MSDYSDQGIEDDSVNEDVSSSSGGNLPVDPEDEPSGTDDPEIGICIIEQSGKLSKLWFWLRWRRCDRYPSISRLEQRREDCKRSKNNTPIFD